MEYVDCGRGNSMDKNFLVQRALQQKRFRYIVVSTNGIIPGAIGGSSNFELKGTNELKEILLPEVFNSAEIYNTKNGKHLSAKLLARKYIKMLSRDQREELIKKSRLDSLIHEQS